MAANSQRIDVILQTQRIIEMFSRAQGASVKEVCRELEINERTFYRRIDDLTKMDIPITNKGDPDAATNGKRWYIVEGYKNEVRLFLTPAEKMLLRQLVYKATPANEIEKSLSDKINKAVLHDTNDVNFAVSENDMEQQEVVSDEEDFENLTKAIELKRRITFGGVSSDDVIGLSKRVHFWFLDAKFEPYTFVKKGKEYLVIGNAVTDEGNFIVGVKLNDFGAVKILMDEPFVVPEDYDVQAFMDKWFYDKRSTHIKLAVDNDVAEKISFEKWFDNKSVELFFDCQVIEFDTRMLDDAKKLILSFGSKVKVLEPRSLVKNIAREVAATSSLYEKNAVPKCSYKHRVVVTGNFENASFISFGRHTTNYALYNYYLTWWRAILKLEEEDARELLRIGDGEEGLPVWPMGLFYKADGHMKHRIVPQSIILYKNRIFLEYPMKREISGKLDWLVEIEDDLKEEWWHDSSPCKMRYIFRRILKYPEDERWEPYKKMHPEILLTGIDKIDPEIAAELNEKGTILGHIPAASFLYTRTHNADGTDTVSCHFYGKK